MQAVVNGRHLQKRINTGIVGCLIVDGKHIESRRLQLRHRAAPSGGFHDAVRRACRRALAACARHYHQTANRLYAICIASSIGDSENNRRLSALISMLACCLEHQDNLIAGRRRAVAQATSHYHDAFKWPAPRRHDISEVKVLIPFCRASPWRWLRHAFITPANK